MHLHINTFGSYLHVKDELFEIRKKTDTGEVQKHQYAAHKLRGIVLGMGTALSADAVRLAMRHNVDLLFVEGDGSPVGRVWHSRLGSTTKIRKAQLEASLGPVGLQWTKAWLDAKLGNQLALVGGLRKHRVQHGAYLDDKLTRLAALRAAVAGLDGPTVETVAPTLRGLEGTAGRLYFEALSFVLPADYRFAGRSSRPFNS